MYAVCLENDGSYVSRLDREGLITSSDPSYAILSGSDVGCIALIMFLTVNTDFEFDDFFIQYLTEDSPS